MQKYLALLIIMLITACSNPLDKPEPLVTPEQREAYKVHEESSAPKVIPPLRVALLAPMSGDKQKIGQNVLDAVSLALYELKVNNAEIIPIDTNTKDGTIEVLQRLKDEKPDVVLGPVFASTVKSIHRLLCYKDVPMLTLSNNLELVGKKHVYLLGMVPTQEMARVIQYAKSQGYDKSLALLPQTKYGHSIHDVLKREEDFYMQIRNVQYYVPINRGGLRNLNAAIIKLNLSLAEQKEQAESDMLSEHKYMLILPEGRPRLERIVQQLYLMVPEDVQFPRLIGSSQWDEVQPDKRLNGSWFADIPQDKISKFEQRFKQVFGYNPLKLASFAYDGVALIKELIVEHEGRHIFEEDRLTDPRGFVGISGIFTIEEDGSNTRALNIYEIKNGKLKLIDKAASDAAFRVR